MRNDTAKVQLVTIICGNELERRLANDLKALGGVTGYTVTRAEGRGLHGPRKFGLFDGANVRIEVLVTAPWREKITEMLLANYEGDPLTAFAQEVEALPGNHFLPPPAPAIRADSAAAPATTPMVHR
jgi:hypothetical protein